MADIITALRSGINEQMLNALHSILRNVYATGRSSRGILRQVLQVSSHIKNSSVLHSSPSSNIIPIIINPDESREIYRFLLLVLSSLIILFWSDVLPLSSFSLHHLHRLYLHPIHR